MRIVLILILFAIASLTCHASVERVGYTSAPSASKTAEGLSLTFTADVPHRLLDSESVRIIPYYIAGRDTVWFPEMGLYTASGKRFHRRRVTFGRETEGSIDVVCGRSVREAGYAASRFIPTTEGGRLYIRQELYNCCRRRVLAIDTVFIAILSDTVTAHLPEAAEAATAATATSDTAAARHIALHKASVTLHIDYPVDVHTILPSFAGNAAELARLDSLLRRPAADTAYVINSITVDGYASPEDTYIHNLELSRRRAEGMRDYIARRYILQPDIMTAVGHGEDWEGLCKVLRKSDMPYRDEALGIIARLDLWQGREKRLMDLHYGRPYRQMLAEIFPSLRRIVVTVHYTIKSEERPHDGGKEAQP